MKRTTLGRLLGLTLAVVIGVSTPVSAFAQEEVGGLLAVTEETEELAEATEEVAAEEAEEAQEDASVETTEETLSDDEKAFDEEDSEDEADATAESSEEAEDAEDQEAADLENEQPEEEVVEESVEAASLLGTADEEEEKITIPVEFIDFGPEYDAAIAENGYYVGTSNIEIAKRNGTYDSVDEFYIWVTISKMTFIPQMENGVLSAIETNEGCRCTSYELEGKSWDYEYNRKFVINVHVSKEFLESGKPLVLTAKWDMEELNDRFVLDANGGVFDDSFYGDSTITYSLGAHGIAPAKAAQTKKVTVTYSEDRTQAYVPVMRNGFFPVSLDNTGFNVDIADRPYEGKLPILYWNTERDGSGQTYSTDEIFVVDEFKNEDVTHKKSLTLYAMYPQYFAADFILDGKSYFADCWIDPSVGRNWTFDDLYDTAKAIYGEDSFEKEGYKLSWYLDEGCTVSAAFSQRVGSCDRKSDAFKFYGKWTAIPGYRKIVTGTVRFANIDNAVAGSKNLPYDAVTGAQVEVGKTLDLSKYLFTKAGYTFKNWTVVDSGTTYGKTAKITKLFKNEGEEITLSANWTPVTYKITYALNGGSQDKNVPKNYNIETETQLPVPVKTGYVFKGWDIKRDGKAVTDAAELAAIYDAENNRIKKGTFGNLTLSAKFVPFEYKILFHVEGQEKPITAWGYGESDPLHYTDTLNFNDAAISIEEELGWHETKVGQDCPGRDKKIIGFSRTEGGKVDFDRIKKYTKLTNTEAELHLYAVTEDNTYYINYHLDGYEGATLSKPIYTFKSGNKKFKLPTASCPGYKFIGWEFDHSRNSSKSLFYSWIRKWDNEYADTVAANVNNDIEVWPEFEANKIKVFVSPNGSGVYEDVQVETYEGTDIRRKKVTGKRAFGEVYYQTDVLASEWCNESMNDWYRPGYEFVGYSKNPKATSADEIFTELYYGIEDFSSVATSGSGTIYCIWKKNVNTIDNTYATIIDDGEIVDEHFWGYKTEGFPFTMTYGEGKSITLPKASLEGYEFLGWKSDYLDKFSKVTKKNGYITAVNPGNCYDLEVYPVFRRCVYDLVINCNGGSYDKLKTFYVERGLDYSDDVAPYLTGFTHLNVTRKGYKLMGFARDPKGKTGLVVGADGKPAYNTRKLILNGNKKVTLYAIWKK